MRSALLCASREFGQKLIGQDQEQEQEPGISHLITSLEYELENLLFSGIIGVERAREEGSSFPPSRI